MDVTPKLNRFPKTRFQSPADQKRQLAPSLVATNRLSHLMPMVSHEATLKVSILNTVHRLQAETFNKRLKDRSLLEKYRFRMEYFVSFCEQHSLSSALPEMAWFLHDLSKQYFK